jgi:hypothetical protein
MTQQNVYIAVPHHSELTPQVLPGLILASERHRYSINTEGGSLLALMFNVLWCRALNKRDQGITHFAMHHSDIEAEPGWVDKLIDELDAKGADIISTVMPIKDNRGVTSTGWQDNQTKKIRRFTMTEIMAMAPTFNIYDTEHLGASLMVNTGLWLCRFTEPWVEEVCFHIQDAITRQEDGTFWPRCIPEDWAFSAWAAEQGLHVAATRAVKAIHHGRAGYSNQSAWGQWQTDQGDY